MHDLVTLMRPAFTQLQSVGLDETATLTPDSLPVPPALLRTDDAVAQWGQHRYSGMWQIEKLDLCCEREVYLAAGLVLISAALHSVKDPITIELLHPGSGVRRIVLEPWTLEHIGGSRAQIHVREFQLLRREVERYPWSDATLSCDRRLPIVRKGSPAAPDGDENENVLGFGPGNLLMAELMVNLGAPESSFETVLEISAGAGGVASGSAELTLSVPGNGLWEPLQRRDPP
jgi:hypothetical protein